MTFALKESVSAASISYTLQLFHSGPLKRVRMPALEAHTLPGTLPETREPLWVRAIEPNIECLLFARHRASGCFNAHYSQEVCIAHFVEEETERLNYSPKVPWSAREKWGQDLNSILPQEKICSLSPKHQEAICRQKVILLATFVLGLHCCSCRLRAPL